MFQNVDGIQKVSKVNIDATMKSFEVTTKTVQAITTEMTDYTKRSFENNTKALEKLFGAKRVCQSKLRRLPRSDCQARQTLC
jgi:hypothetical protein